jgi:hypothetical protein
LFCRTFRETVPGNLVAICHYPKWLTVLRLADESLSVAGSSLAYIQTAIAAGSLSIARGPLLATTVLDYEISEEDGGRKSDEIQVRPQTIVHAQT